MKKQPFLFVYIVCIWAFSLVSCSDNDDDTPPVKTKEDLPLEAQSFLSYYLLDFTDPEIKLVDDSVYTAYYKDQDLSVNFDKNGKWMLAETSKVLPKTLLDCLPQKIRKATETFHEADTIKGMQVKEYGYMLKLPKIQLAYNSTGEYIGYDEESKADKLSNVSRNFIKQYWPDAEVTSVILNAEDYSKRYYLVYLSDETVLRFDYNKGTWQKIDGGIKPLSKDVLSLMPEDIIKDAENTGRSPIVSMEIEQVGLYNFRFVNGNGYTIATEDYKGTPANPSEVRTAVLEFIKSHWPENDISIIGYSWGSMSPDEYRYFLSNDFECIFTSYKEWILIDGGDQEIPQSIQKELPSAVLNCVNEGFWGNKIVKIEKVIEETTKMYYYISLDANNAILKINGKGELVDYWDRP